MAVPTFCQGNEGISLAGIGAGVAIVRRGQQADVNYMEAWSPIASRFYAPLQRNPLLMSFEAQIRTWNWFQAMLFRAEP